MIKGLQKSFKNMKYVILMFQSYFMFGVCYRVRVYSRVVRNRLAAFILFLLTLFRSLGFFGYSYQDFIPYANTTNAIVTMYWDSLPILLRSTLPYSFLTLFILLGFWSFCTILSKEQLFRIATRRLNDDIPPDRRATVDNGEASLLLDKLVSGRRKSRAYSFLTDLWRPAIEQTNGLSLLTFQGLKKPLPIVCIDISHLTGPNLMNSLLKVESQPRFSYLPLRCSESGARQSFEELHLRKPFPRYLRRYRGATPDETTFEDDYVGYNVCLKSINFKDNKFDPPIDCTPELYGNILDSAMR